MVVSRVQRKMRANDITPMDLFLDFVHASNEAFHAATLIAACYRARYERKRVYSAMGR